MGKGTYIGGSTVIKVYKKKRPIKFGSYEDASQSFKKLLKYKSMNPIDINNELFVISKFSKSFVSSERNFDLYKKNHSLLKKLEMYIQDRKCKKELYIIFGRVNKKMPLHTYKNNKKKISRVKFDLKKYVNNMIENTEKMYDFKEGYKLLYCPWDTISSAKIAFISLNPGGKTPCESSLRLISEEKGNSYELESNTTKSPITFQFMELCKLIGEKPINILTGTIFPFRSKSWESLTYEQRNAGLLIGKQFWKKSLRNLNLIICVGKTSTENIIDLSDFKEEKIYDSGWGDIKITRYKDSKNRTLIHLPHLSTFKLFSRPECLPPLKKVFDL